MAKKKPTSEDRSRAVSKSSRVSAKSTPGTIYQLKITLNDIQPPVWRRVQTRDCTLGQLHDIIQIVMGWDDYHLHEFEIGEERYGLPEQWESGLHEPEVRNSRKIKLSQLVEQGVKKFHYQYDMGDSWWHTIQIEKTLLAEPGVKYPRCIDGKRACPPEDCGGPWGYYGFLEAIQNPKHKQHEELLEWMGGEFNPEEFDLEAVNKELKE